MASRSSSRPPSSDPDLAALLSSWELALRAERKSSSTVKTYGDGVRRFLTWCEQTDTAPVLDRHTVGRFTVSLLDAGAEPATARSRHLSLCRFSSWLVEEGELADDPMVGSKPPRLDTKVTPVLTGEQLAALVKACGGRDIRDRRDEAVVRLMIGTGMRAGEVTGLTVADVDLKSWAGDRGPREGRPRPDRAHRTPDRPRDRPVPAAAGPAPARRGLPAPAR